MAAPAPVASPTPATPSLVEKPKSPAHFVLQDGLAHFDFDRSDLSDQGKAELDAWLQHPLPKGTSLQVTGHADRLGPATYNLKLSGKRAQTVKKYLQGKGVNGKSIQVVAKGESEPVKQCHGRRGKGVVDCLAPNRRVEIDVK